MFLLRIALMISALAAPALAADGEREGLFGLSLENLLEQEVVSASLIPHSSAEAPASVHVIPREVIERRGYTDLRALLEDLPEIEVNRWASARNRDRYTLRGITGNGKFVVMRDGFRVTSASGTPHSIGEQYSLADIERVEVILGPASALYGGDAFAGAINMISRDGGDISGVSLSSGYGRFATQEHSIVMGTRVGEVDFAAQASFYRSDGADLSDYYEGDFAWYHDRYRSRGEVRVSPFAPEEATQVVERLPFDMSVEAHSVNVRVGLGAFRLQYDTSYTSHASTNSVRPEFGVYTDEARFGHRIQTFTASHRARPFEGLKLAANLSTQLYELDPDSGFMNSFSGYDKVFKYESNVVTRSEGVATYTVTEDATVTAGVGYTHLRSTPNTGDLPTSYDPEESADLQGHIYPGSDLNAADGRDLRTPQDVHAISRDNYDVFGEIFFRPFRQLSLTTGARYDHNTRYGDTFEPRLGVAARLTDSLVLKALYGEAFLAPSPHEAYSHYGAFTPAKDANGDVVGLESQFFRLPNPDLEPERLRTVEASLTYNLDERLVISVNGYFTAIRNLITNAVTTDETFKGHPVAAVERKVNQGEGRLFGGTLRLETRWTLLGATLNPYVAYTYSDGEIDEVPLPVSATHWIKGGLDMEWRGLSLSVRVLRRGEARHGSLVDAGGEAETIPGATLVNGYLLYRDVAPNAWVVASLFVRGRNLLDQRYYNVSNENPDVFAASPQDPLRVMGGVKLDY